MSAWNHSICGECWILRALARPTEGKLIYGNDAMDNDVPMAVMLPVCLINAPLSTCCYCGSATEMGAYIRDTPGLPKFCHHDESEPAKQPLTTG